MKIIKSLMLFCIGAFFVASNAIGQANPSIAILPLNAGGVVAVDDIMDVQVTISNTLSGTIVASKLRPVITIPALATILPNAQQTGLPPGWVIVTNASGQIRVCNASDPVGGFEQRNIIIKVQGLTVGGPTACQSQLNYGGATCAVTGPQPTGNVAADDFAASSITVIPRPLPLTLLTFNAALLNCKPSLNWATESEINADRFEIERNDISNASAGWKYIGSITANGTLQKSTYKFFDATLNTTTANVFYRLKMIDKDGLYKYSEALRVNVNCKTVQVDVYPNPVQNGGKLYVSLAGAGENIQASLLSASGQLVLKNKMNNGTNYITTTNIADGIYILNITDANGLDKKIKVLVQH